ncbi:hypothetical protein GO730_05625 [Spirosoma sp. HMF3257]|uniref:Uncharacterized protein n=1 Tax=Spirosoma telluris TaxID=2183553 RepID=A0A327NGK1_9BACT|nr:hypothetical protein [Spirosoma telluris]RAI73955.1 hypothetical protein HMF3257_05585 [Spirosoma telluris]
MHKLKLKLYKEQFRQLVLFIPDPGHLSKRDTVNKPLEEILLLEWRGKLTRLQILTWHQREHNRQYTLSLPLSVAVALWRDLQNYALTDELQLLADELDHELIDAGLRN